MHPIFRDDNYVPCISCNRGVEKNGFNEIVLLFYDYIVVIFFSQAEGQLANMRSEQDRFREDTDEAITRLRTRVEELEKERGDLNCKLEDERRSVN